jgi:hypothetical protein
LISELFGRGHGRFSLYGTDLENEKGAAVRFGQKRRAHGREAVIWEKIIFAFLQCRYFVLCFSI